MTLMDLHEILGNRIMVTLQEMPEEKRQIENERSVIILNAAKQMINNANTILKAQQQFEKNGSKKDPIAVKLISAAK